MYCMCMCKETKTTEISLHRKSFYLQDVQAPSRVGLLLPLNMIGTWWSVNGCTVISFSSRTRYENAISYICPRALVHWHTVLCWNKSAGMKRTWTENICWSNVNSVLIFAHWCKYLLNVMTVLSVLPKSTGHNMCQEIIGFHSWIFSCMSFDPIDRLLVFTPTESEQNLLIVSFSVILKGKKRHTTKNLSNSDT